MKQDYTFLIGGEAGQGLQTIGGVLAKALAKMGLHIFAYQDYHSRVRGGHNFFQIRAASFPVHTHVDQISLLVALDAETIKIHRSRVAPDGGVVYDSGNMDPQEGLPNPFPLPLSQLGKEYGGRAIMGNTAAVGAIWNLIQGDPPILEETLKDMFSSKGEEVSGANIKAARGGVEHVKKNFPAFSGCLLEKQPSPPRMLLTGNDAVALGALAAGCQFISAYPMSPASSVFTAMGRHVGRLPLVFEQAEDEIAAIHMSLGASFAGVRSMVATSGGGFSLMAEGLSLAGCTETPLVLFLAQRPGPATGLATRTEQGDLLFALNAGHGEFPRAILAPGNATEAFWLTVKAFNLADKYQIPVFVMSDQYLADASFTVEPFDLTGVEVDRGKMIRDGSLGMDYQRYKFTSSGISPRAYPGGGEWTVVSSGNEHDEKGLPTENADLRKKMVDKRLGKALHLAGEMASPSYYGPGEPEKILLTWGSACGASREGADALNGQGERVGVMHLTELWPFPGLMVQKALENVEEIYTVEMNATGQLGRLLRQETGIKPKGAVLKYDGRPMNGVYVADELGRGGENPW